MSIACTRTGWVAALLAQAAGPETSSDEMLIRRIAEGDQLAMRTLFGRHRVPLYRWLLRLVGDEVLAEDLLSDVFLDVWRQAASPEHGEVIDLVYLHGKSVKEVAEIIGIATATVKTRMFYARKKLADFVAAA
jgi:DNA-directed RNA polymerase specialized sigma24 family protein